jgi:hypothetical protein
MTFRLFLFTVVLFVGRNIVLFVECRAPSISRFYKKPGGYSVFYPKFDLDEISTQLINQEEKNECDVSEIIRDLEITSGAQTVLFEDKLLDGYDPTRIQFLVHKMFNLFHFIPSKNYKILITDDHKLVVSVKSWILGWYHYPFHILMKSNSTFPSINETDKFTIDLISMNGHRNLQEFMGRIEIFKGNAKSTFFSTKKSKTDKNSDTMMKLTLYDLQGEGGGTNRLKNSNLKFIFNKLSFHVKQHFKEITALYDVRRKQKAKYQQLSQEKEKAKQKLELDKIIHPEKYKKKGAPLSGGDGAGRYAPSAATQARRQVKKG